jgi:ElaB/YqjD/DUF883 family membrane-anchored ribosome-binding protein
MQKVRSEFPEIEEIRHDIDSLKDNVVELSRHIKSEGKAQTSKLTEIALDRIADLRKSATFEYQRAEKAVKAKPGQSVAIAFAAGLLASMLIRRGN